MVNSRNLIILLILLIALIGILFSIGYGSFRLIKRLKFVGVLMILCIVCIITTMFFVTERINNKEFYDLEHEITSKYAYVDKIEFYDFAGETLIVFSNNSEISKEYAESVFFNTVNTILNDDRFSDSIRRNIKFVIVLSDYQLNSIHIIDSDENSIENNYKVWHLYHLNEFVKEYIF